MLNYPLLTYTDSTIKTSAQKTFFHIKYERDGVFDPVSKTPELFYTLLCIFRSVVLEKLKNKHVKNVLSSPSL